MSFWIKNIRYFILTCSSIFALAVGFYIMSTDSTDALQNIRLVQIYAFCAVIFLYLTLLISPLYSAVPALPFRTVATLARKALGLSAFYFGFLHAYYAFFGLLNGFEGWGFLGAKYQLAVLVGFFSLIIFSLLAATSFDYTIRKLGKKWKYIHRSIYLGGILVLVHLLMLGSHFSEISRSIPQFFGDMLVILLCLEGIRLDKYISKKWSNTYLRMLNFAVFLIAGIALLYLFPFGGLASFNYQSHS